MKREYVIPRTDKKERLEEIGLSFHDWDNYWKEDVCYHFTESEVTCIEEVTEELHEMCLTAVEKTINDDLMGKLGIPEKFHEKICESFKTEKDKSLYGRFDLAYDGVNQPKMLEYNADTPTSLLESAVAQWYWMESVKPNADQFNSLHEKLVARWNTIFPTPGASIYVSSLTDNEEDWVCTQYLIETIIQSGKIARRINIEDIGWDNKSKRFVDMENNPINNLFKLYPWEWMMREEFGDKILEGSTYFIEPIWKSVLSCKGILPILWSMYPNHPNLLEAYFDSNNGLTSFAKKPIYSREGANIELIKDGTLIAKDTGPYGAEGYIFQELVNIPDFDGKFPIIGSWIVGNDPAGMCIREDTSRITTNMSNFVPHYFTS